MISKTLSLKPIVFLVATFLLLCPTFYAQEIDVTGNYVSIADGDVTPSFTDSTDFGNVVITASKSDTFRIHNSDVTNLNIFGSSITGTDASMFVITVSPTSPIATGDSTDLVITFSPTSAGLKTATVNIFSDDADENPYTFAIQGTGVSTTEIDVQGNFVSIANNDLTPSLADDTDYGNVNLGFGLATNFKIFNAGAPDLDLYGTSITGTNPSDFLVTSVLTSSVSGGDSTTIQVTFNPTAPGLRQALFTIFNSDVDESNYTFRLQGTGVGPEINVTGNSNTINDGDNTPNVIDNTDFGGVVVLATQGNNFFIENTNVGTTLNITSVSVTGAHSGDFAVIGAPSSVAGGSGSGFTINFTPSATGIRYAEVEILNDDDDESIYNFTIQGNGLSAQEIEIEGNNIVIVDGDNSPATTDDTDFGSVSAAAGSILKTFTINNTGGQDLTVNNIAISGTNAADFTLTSVHSFPETVNGGASNTFDITFDPSATGLRQATITVTNDDGDEGTYNFDIQGTGTAASEYTMDDGTDGSTYTECAGTIYDDGGPNGKYKKNKDYTYTIDPTNAEHVAITFVSFDVEDGPGISCGYDYLDVDYGATTIRYCNDNPPALNTPIYGDANTAIVLTWHSDPGVEENGFEIQWEGIISANVSSTDPTCNGAGNGIVSISSPGGAGSGTPTYQYEINGGGFANSPNSWNNLSGGAQNVSIRDVNGCYFDTTVTLTEPSAVVLGETHTDETCAGSSDGTLNLSGSGGAGGYTYSFNNGPYQGSGAFTGIGSGSFPVKVQDANGCVDSTNIVFNIGGSAGPTGTGVIGGDDFYCLGDSTIKSYTISGISNANNYTWTFARINNPTSPLPVIVSGQGTSTLLLQMAGVTDSLYIIVTASNACGTAAPDSIMVVESNFLLPVAFNMTPATINVGANAVDLTLTVNQPGGLFGGNGVIPANDEFDPGIAGTGTHAITYDIDDPNGCHHTLTDFVTVVTNVGVVTVAGNMCHDGAIENVSATPSPAFTVNSITGFDIDGFATGIIDGNPTGDYLAQVDPSQLTRGSHSLNFNFVTVEMVTVNTTPIICCCNGFPPSPYQCGWNTTTIPVFTNQTITQNFYVDSIGGINIITSSDSACVDQTNIVNFVAQYFHNQGSGLWSTTAASGWTVINPTTGHLNPSVAGTGGSPYQVTYEYTSTENGSGCKAYDTTYFIVHPLPNPWFTLNNYYSDQDPFFSTNPTPDSSGFYAGAGMVGTDFYPNLAGAGNHTIIYNYSDPSTGCSNIYADSTIVIANTGTITGLAATYCYEDPIDTIFGDPNQGGISGTVVGTFSISASSNSPLAINNIGPNQATFNPALAGPGNHLITFSYVDEVPFQVTQTVLVDSIGDVYFTGLNVNKSYCLVDPQFQLNGQFNHPSGSGNFTYTGPPTSFINTGNSAFLTPQDTGTWNITYTYTSALSGCTSDSTETIVIHPLPTLSFALSSSYCSNDSNLTIVGNPRGGSFSSSAALLNVFGTPDSMLLSPSNTQVGANIVTYDYTDVFGCSNSLDSTFTLFSAPDVQIDNDTLLADYCELSGSHPVTGLINGSNISQGYFWGPGIIDNDSTDGYADFWPDSATVGTGYTVYYFYTDGNGCSGLDSSLVNVNALPIVNLLGINASKQYCNNHDVLGNPIQFNGVPQISSGISGTFVLDGVVSSADQVNFDPTAYPNNQQDTIDISYTFTDNKGCVNTAVDTVYVNPAAHPDFTISGICIVDTIDFTDITVPTPDGLNTWTWSIDDSTYTSQNARHKFATNGNHNINLEITTVAGCTSDTTAIIEFGDKPTADFYWVNECFDPMVPIMFYDSSTTVSSLDTLFYNWDMGDMIGTSTAEDTIYFYGAPGDYNVELIISTTFNCIDTMTKLVSVKPLITNYPYFTDFQSGPDSWTAKTIVDFDPNNSWAHSEWHYDYFANNLSWSTSHLIDSSDYNSDERSYVSSPCYDFTTLQKPMIRFDLWRDFADIGDGAVLESSIDNGQTWQVVGQEQSTDPGINWYNHIVINNGDGPGGSVLGGQPLGWSNITDLGWMEVRHDLDHLIGNAKVIFRIAFSANGAGENKGFAFDNVWIGERSKYVLVEHFTNTSCVPCAVTSSPFNPFMGRYGKDLIDIQYHTNAIAGDKLYADYQAGPSTRELFYGATQLPQTITDGDELNATTALWMTDTLTTLRRSLESAIFDIDLVKTINGNNYDVDATVTVNKNFTEDIDVYMAVIEKQITTNGIVTAGGTVTNGELEFNNVVKAMLPDAGGTRISNIWNPGDSQLISQTWNSSNAVFYDAGGNDDIEIVVFVQNATTKEVYQTATTDTSFINIAIGIDDETQASDDNPFQFNLYPNPTDGDIFIMFNRSINDDANITIFNEMGSLIDQREVSNGVGTSFSTDDYANGIYFMSVIYKGQRFTKRFMVMR